MLDAHQKSLVDMSNSLEEVMWDASSASQLLRMLRFERDSSNAHALIQALKALEQTRMKSLEKLSDVLCSLMDQAHVSETLNKMRSADHAQV